MVLGLGRRCASQAQIPITATRFSLHIWLLLFDTNERLSTHGTRHDPNKDSIKTYRASRGSIDQVDRSDLLLALRLVRLLVVRGRTDKRIDGLRHDLLPRLLQAPDKAVLGRLVLLSQPFLLMSVRLV
jgi:hypothetical protein